MPSQSRVISSKMHNATHGKHEIQDARYKLAQIHRQELAPAVPDAASTAQRIYQMTTRKQPKHPPLPSSTARTMPSRFPHTLNEQNVQKSYNRHEQQLQLAQQEGTLAASESSTLLQHEIPTAPQSGTSSPGVQPCARQSASSSVRTPASFADAAAGKWWPAPKPPMQQTHAAPTRRPVASDIAIPAAAFEEQMGLVTKGCSLTPANVRGAELGLSDERAWVLGTLSTTRYPITRPSTASFMRTKPAVREISTTNSSFCVQGSELASSMVDISWPEDYPTVADLRALYGPPEHNSAHAGHLGPYHLSMAQHYHSIAVPVNMRMSRPRPNSASSLSATTMDVPVNVHEETFRKHGKSSARRIGSAANDPSWVQQKVEEGGRFYTAWGAARRSMPDFTPPDPVHGIHRNAPAYSSSRPSSAAGLIACQPSRATAASGPTGAIQQRPAVIVPFAERDHCVQINNPALLRPSSSPACRGVRADAKGGTTTSSTIPVPNADMAVSAIRTSRPPTAPSQNSGMSFSVRIIHNSSRCESCCESSSSA